MSDGINLPISPEAVIERLKHLPPRKGLPFSNDETMQVALALRGLLWDLQIYNARDVGMTLARISQ